MNFTGNPIAVQLYTLREDCAADFFGTLEKLKSIGIGAVEFAGLHEKNPEEVKAKLDELGLKTAGCHVGLKELQDKFDETKKTYIDILNCPYVTIPNGPRKFDDGGESWKKFCREVREMKKRSDAAGFKLAYHNHAFEFDNKVGDKTAFDIMFHEKPEESPLCELDLCWVSAGKHDPVNELRRFKGRVKLAHVKDLDPGMPPRDTEVGSGILQWPAIYKAAEEVGIQWLIIERDKPQGAALDSVKQSLNFLKQAGLEK